MNTDDVKAAVDAIRREHPTLSTEEVAKKVVEVARDPASVLYDFFEEQNLKHHLVQELMAAYVERNCLRLSGSWAINNVDLAKKSDAELAQLADEHGLKVADIKQHLADRKGDIEATILLRELDQQEELIRQRGEQPR